MGLSVSALLFTAFGFGVIVLHRLHPRAAFPGWLRRRGVSPHLWGFHFLGSGSMLTGVIWALQHRPWSEVPPVMRGPVLLGLGWVLVSLGLALAALVLRSRNGSPLVPGPGFHPRAWPNVYRFYLVVGIVDLGVLAGFQFI